MSVRKKKAPALDSPAAAADPAYVGGTAWQGARALLAQEEVDAPAALAEGFLSLGHAVLPRGAAAAQCAGYMFSQVMTETHVRKLGMLVATR